MRITTSMFYNDMLQNIQQNLEPMLTSQEQLSTGLKMNRPSDDPADLGTVLSLSKMLDENKNETNVLAIQQSRLSQADSSLGEAAGIVNRASQLMLQASNGTLGSSDITAIAQEAGQLLQDMVSVGNNTRGAGPGENFFQWNDSTSTVTLLATAPTVSTATLSHDSVDPGYIYNSAVSGISNTNPHTNVTANSVLSVLRDVYLDLKGNATGNFSTDIGNLTAATDWITANRTQVGAVEDRLQSQQNQIANQNLSLTQLMAGFRDTDMAAAAVKFSQEQTTYQAALATSAKVMQISLTNYL